jgi:hypothetical protein
MQAYLELRTLEANLLRSTISDKYGGSTYLTANCGPDHGLLSPYRQIGSPYREKFRWTILYDFNGQVTYQGANTGDKYRRILVDANWYSIRPFWGKHPGKFAYFNRYDRWWELPFPSVETNDST